MNTVGEMRPIETITERFLASASIAYLGTEQDEDAHEDRETIRERVLPYLLETCPNVLSDWEQEILSRKSADWSSQEEIWLSWNGECAATLGWVLGLPIEVEPWDDCMILADLEEFFGPEVTVPKLLPNCSRRQLEEVVQVNLQAHAWRWRALTEMRHRRLVASNPDFNYRGLARLCASKYIESGQLTHQIDGDFPALGKAYSELSLDGLLELHRIGFYRRKALEWALGNAWEDEATSSSFLAS